MCPDGLGGQIGDMPKSSPRSRTRAAVLLSTAAVLLTTSCTVPSATAAGAHSGALRLEPPEPTGPHPVGRVDVPLTDDQRRDVWADEGERELMVSVWYPAATAGGERAPLLSGAMADKLSADTEKAGLPPGAVDWAGSTTNAAADAPVSETTGGLPTVLYSPGFADSRSMAAANAEELASRGYAVVTIDHTYESQVVEFPDGRVAKQFQPEEGWDTEAFRKAVAVRVADTRFVLDSLEAPADEGGGVERNRLPDGVGDALDLSSVGMYGHSMGGFTSAEAMLVDERIDAGANLDGSIAYHVGDEAWGDSTTRGVDRPFLLVGGGSFGHEGLPHTSANSPDWRLFRDASGPSVLELYLEKAEHMSFTDQQWILPRVDAEYGLDSPAGEKLMSTIGTIDPDRSVAAQRAYLTAFAEQELRGEEQPLLDGPSKEHPDVEFVD